jgi:NAD(P)-dependent dehydrogenase (short-subunit alcohol dehydrogenase family)
MSTESYSDLFSCVGKVAVVVGSSGLIGREVCAALRAGGADVWEADVSHALDVPRAIPMDVTDEISIEHALDTVVASVGRIDIVVNCAYPRTADWGADVDDVAIESWTKNLDAQLGGTFALCRAAARRMKDTGGSVVSLSSIYGLIGPSWEVYEGTTMTMPSAYSAIKAGVLGLTRFLATRYGSSGIRFNAVSPGGVFDSQAERFVQRYEALTPLGRMARPRDVVGAIVFLASDAACYITGQNIVVDGGWTTR